MPITGSQKALMVAQSGIMRSGASRSNYFTSKKVFISVNGVQYGDARLTAANKVLMNNLAVVEVLNEIPNTAAFTTSGFEPIQGQDVVITLGSSTNMDRLFAGTVLNRRHHYFEKPASWLADVNCIDYTWHLTRRRISGVFTNQSATDIAKAIVAHAPGFTSYGVQLGLATLDVFSFTDVDILSALSQLAKRIGGYCDVDYHKDVHLFTVDSSVSNPLTLTATHPSLSNFSVTYDLSQVRTRWFVEGGGVNSLALCGPGETIIPVDTIAWYNAAGGNLKSGSQHLTYSGVSVGGGGSLVGPGAAPSAAPALALQVGAGLGTGTYQYAYTDVTAAGESLPSPIGSITTVAAVADPVNMGNPHVDAGSPYSSGGLTGVYMYKYTFYRASDGKETAPGPASASVNSINARNEIALGALDAPPTGYVRRWYRTAAGGSVYKLMPESQDNVNWLENVAYGFFQDTMPDSYLGASVPASNNTGGNQVAISGIAVGPSTPVAVTQRKVYRTVVNGSQLKLLTTIADNTTTTFSDSTADGSLGANAPTSDTSTLAQPTGQVLAGANTLLMASTANASTTGGWAVIGNGQQVIRYTGVSGNTLTGIPGSGIPGAITATVSYNSTVTFPPSIIGIPSGGTGSIVYSILPGDAVNILVQVDDFTAQAALAALIGGGDDGVVEDFLQDNRLSETEARARGNAQLTFTKDPLVSISYTCRDRNTHAGRTITVSLGAPTSVSGTFQIQRVSWAQFLPNVAPTATVQASSSRFSLEDLLRIFRQAA